MAVLVAGGAGYIGSHNVRALLARGREVVVVDNLLTGHRASLPVEARLHVADIRDKAALGAIFASEKIESVVHFAASSLVGDSMRQPLPYFDNNVSGLITLLEVMLAHNVKNIVFSSSAAVYGEPKTVPISEDAPLMPANPYGETKLCMERIMRWAREAHGMNFVSLRYFNVAGAWPGGIIGEDHRPESHLVPLILQVPLGARPEITVFGTDYPTRDGSCVRDYLDVMDLTEAHLLALEHLENGGDSIICNLGNGQGFTVLEMIAAAREVTGHPIPARVAQRRAGDPANLVASADLAREKLGWLPKKDIDQIIASAWEWHKNHPHGFNA